MGALLLSAACENQSGAPGESSFIPRPSYVSQEEAAPQIQTRVAGFLFDPEAFFLSVATCGPSCPFPPLLKDDLPLYLRSALPGASMSLHDPTTGQNAQITAATTSPQGFYTLEKVPSRETPYFLPSTPGGALSLLNIPFPLPPVPPASYLPTVTYRPVLTGHNGCYGIETGAISDKGILEAVARYLTFVESNPTSVADFVNPAKYSSVVVFWHWIPGMIFLRAPAGNTTVEASAGRVINVTWPPPGTPLPPGADALKSPRGFMVAPGAPTSQIGVSVALLPASATPPVEVVYQMKDASTDPVVNAAQLRPWTYPQIRIKPMPGVITYAGIQLFYSSGPATRIYSPALCREPIP